MEDERKIELEDSEKVISERKRKLKNKFFSWVQGPYDKIFLIILLISFIIRLGIFFKTMDQSVWWDAADYLSTAKRWGLGLQIRDIWYYRRGFFWPLFSAFFFKAGIGEIGIRFSEVLFSTGIVAVSYFLVKEMFNKRLALATSICLSFSWILLFFTGRPLTSIPGTFFLLTSLLFFWKGYVKNQGNKFVYLFGLFYALSLLTRMQYLMFVPVFFIFIFIKERFRMFKNKSLWITFTLFLIILSPQIILYWQHYGNPITDIMSYYLGIEGVSQIETIERNPSFSLNTFRYFFDLPYILTADSFKTPFVFGIFNRFLSFLLFAFFILGVFYFFSDLFFGFDRIFKDENIKKKLFILLWIIISFLALGYITPNIEQRYIIPTLPFLFLISSVSLLKIGNILLRYLRLNRKLINFLIFFFLIILLVSNFLWAHKLIDIKKTSYLEVKQAGEWIKKHSVLGDKIISASLPQITYYAERDTYSFAIKQEGRQKQDSELIQYPEGKEGFEKFVKDKKPRYLIMSVFESHPQWIYSYLQEHNDTLIPVQAYYQGQQPVLIIYEFKHFKEQ